MGPYKTSDMVRISELAGHDIPRWKVIGAVFRIKCSFRVDNTRRPGFIAGAQFSCQSSPRGCDRCPTYLSPASLLIQHTHRPV